MGDCCNKGPLGLGTWEWIVIGALVIIIFCPGIFTPKAGCNDKYCN